MSEDWSAVALDVKAGIAEAGTVATLRKRSGPDLPWTGEDLTLTDAAIRVVQTTRRIRDGLAMSERTVRVLLIDPTGVVPAKGDQVAMGILPAAVTDDTLWARIAEVEIVAPAGVAVLYKATMDE